MSLKLSDMYRPLFIVYLFSVLSLNVRSGNGEVISEYNFTRIDISQGLSNNMVQCIYKDSRGFMWFGTNSGLNRYDGYTFKIFRHIPSDPTSISDNRIRGIFEDSFGKLWISLWESLVIFDPETERFSSDHPVFHKNIGITYSQLTSVLGDEAGNIWFISGEEGVYVYIMKGDSIIHLPSISDDPSGMHTGRITSVIADRKNDYWITGSDGFLEKLDGHTFKIIDRVSFMHSEIQEPASLQLFPDRDGDIWIYSTNSADGIYLFDPELKNIKHFQSESATYYISNNIVNDIVQDDKGIIWVGTDHGGINLIDKTDYSVQVIQNSPDNVHSLSQNSVNCLYKDDDNIIWAGTFKKGICYYHDNLYKFKLYRHQPNNIHSLPYDDINCFREDKKGNLWIGTNGEGICYFDREKNSFSQFRHNPNDPNSLSNDVVVSLLYDRDGILWSGTFYGGLNRFDGHSFRHFRHDPSDRASISNDHVWEVFEDSEGNFWVGTLGSGLDLFDRTTEKFSHFSTGAVNSVHSDFILHITEDSGKTLWIGTANGVDRYDLEKNKFGENLVHHTDSNSLSHNVVSFIIEDSRKLIWMATQEGLTVYDRENNYFKRLYADDGLPDNTILSVLEDRLSNIWVSTTNGLSNIRITGGKSLADFSFEFINYNQSDGLQGKEFNEGVAFKTSTGELLFGGPDGFNLVNPEQIVFNKKPPILVFTGFQVFNRTIDIGQKVNGRIFLKKSINETTEVILKHYEDVISIEFAALNYIHPEKNKYEYTLEGFNREWLKASESERKATYTNLDPGSYTLRVRASNNDGAWNSTGISLKIIVRPPLWKTKGALIAYVLTLLASLILLRRIILLNERIKNRNEQEKHEAKRRHELDLLKIRFFTNVSHEFRTPLSLIISPLEKMLKGTGDEHQRSQLKLIYRNSKRLLNLVNQLLDFRRMEVQKISIKPSYGDLVKFIDEIHQTFTDLAEKKSILFEYKSSQKEFYTFFDHDKLEKIIFNLVSNAFKFTPEGRSVTIDLDIKRGDAEHPENKILIDDSVQYIVIQVKDTGIGIPADKIEKIFDRFFQDDLPGNLVNQGSGIGLSLASEFVKLHNGSIHVSSEPGRGSIFTVELPVISGEMNTKPVSANIGEANDSKLNTDEQLMPEVQAEPTNKLVLLVEDNDDFRFYLKDNLKAKYSIIEAADGKEGILKAVSQLPDLIVSDVMMPETDGFELCRQLKNNPVSSHIPIILLTARMADNKKKEGYESGADDYITKPFDFEILESRIYNLIAQRERIRKSFQKHFKIEPGEIGITSLDEKLINKALKLVEENMGDPDFSVEKLSRELGMSRVHLYKKLTALTGRTPIEFIRIMRLKRAVQLLEKSQLTVAEIAFEVGFNDPRYFSRYFKSEFGQLPSQYAKDKKGNSGFSVTSIN